MSIEWLLYLIDISKNISNGATFIFITLFTNFIIVIIILAIIKAVNEDEEYSGSMLHKFLKYITHNVWKVIFLGSILCFLPSEKTMYMMLGAHYLKTNTLPSKVELAIEKKIDSYLNEPEVKLPIRAKKAR
jgi:hypothetical protein